MSRKKEKLVLKATQTISRVVQDDFVIVKSINTLAFGVPGDELSRDVVDRILIDNARNIREGSLTVEFIQ